MLAVRVEPKMDSKPRLRDACAQSVPVQMSSSAPPALDHSRISSTTSKLSRHAHSRMIAIPGTGDHARLESVITIRWND
jgi:hypothetical protein